MHEILLKLNDIRQQNEEFLSYKGKNHTNSGTGPLQACQQVLINCKPYVYDVHTTKWKVYTTQTLLQHNTLWISFDNQGTLSLNSSSHQCYVNCKASIPLARASMDLKVQLRQSVSELNYSHMHVFQAHYFSGFKQQKYSLHSLILIHLTQNIN